MMINFRGSYRASFFALIIATFLSFAICVAGYALFNPFEDLVAQLVYSSLVVLILLLPSQLATYLFIRIGMARNFFVLQIFTIAMVGLNAMPAIGFSSPRAREEMSYIPFFIFCFLHNVIYHLLTTPPKIKSGNNPDYNSKP